MPQLSRLPRNVLLGAALGALLGVALIGVGLLRAGLVLLSGAKVTPPSSQDVKVLTFYVGGFSGAGAIVGTARSLLPKTAALVIGCLLGGVVVVLAIAAGDQGLGALDRTDWIVYPILGMTFGAAAAIGLLRKG